MVEKLLSNHTAMVVVVDDGMFWFFIYLFLFFLFICLILKIQVFLIVVGGIVVIFFSENTYVIFPSGNFTRIS